MWWRSSLNDLKGLTWFSNTFCYPCTFFNKLWTLTERFLSLLLLKPYWTGIWLLFSSKFKISQKALQLTVQLESVLLYTDMKKWNSNRCQAWSMDWINTAFNDVPYPQFRFHCHLHSPRSAWLKSNRLGVLDTKEPFDESDLSIWVSRTPSEQSQSKSCYSVSIQRASMCLFNGFTGSQEIVITWH